jgi:response regulator RpfG family c-di-GMP phosphodiesterase
MNGLEVIEALKSLQPDATFMLVSGECDLDLALDAVNQHAVSFVVPKPWDTQELLGLMQRSIEQYSTKCDQREMVVENERVIEQKTRLGKALAQSEEQLAELLLNALDLRDHEKLKLNDSELRDIRKGALLHDVGKIGIPDSILLKPGKLTDEEWVTMRTHTDMGGHLVQAIPGLAGAYDIVTQHHEKWDGSGYPRGLQSEEIALGARIFMIADTLDAILSDRPYRKGAPIEVARQEIQKFGDTQFDPHVVQNFLDVDSQFWIDVRKEFPDEPDPRRVNT